MFVFTLISICLPIEQYIAIKSNDTQTYMSISFLLIFKSVNKTIAFLWENV